MGLTTPVIAVGASTGGVAALSSFVGALGPDAPAAVLVVLHVRPTSREMLAEILDRLDGLPSSAAVDGATLHAGELLCAPPGQHLSVDGDGRVALRAAPPAGNEPTSIDVLFASVARHAGHRAIGVVLTGALSDGANGLAEIVAAGGKALVQEPSTAAAASMPAHAIDAAHIDAIGSPAQLGRIARRLATDMARAGASMMRP